MSRRLIDMSVEDARQAKWEAGVLEHGPVFRHEPIEEFDLEMLDALNYCDEAQRQGYPESRLEVLRCLIRSALVLGREIYRDRRREARP